jgi:DNA-binding transcriptional LysR family regulator
LTIAVIGIAYHAPMELRQLRSFVVLAEELHFRRAAERLGFAQPSLSQQLRRLEASLGVRLLERDRRRVALTPAGTALLEEAREVLAAADRAIDAARGAAAGERGRLRLNLTRSLTGGLAGEIVERFRAQHPGVELELDVGTSTLNAVALREDIIDVAFVRPPLVDDGLEVLELGREPMVCVVPTRHPLARRRTIRPEDLAGEALVWWPEGHAPAPWRDMIAEVYGEDPAGWPPVARAEPEEERIVTAVASGSGISFIGLERSRSLRVPGAVYRRFAPPEPTMGIALAWRRGADAPALQRLREIATDAAAARTTPPPRRRATAPRSSPAPARSHR